MNKPKRRAFLKSAGLGALAYRLASGRVRAANTAEKLVVGVIGTGGMGTAHLKTLAQRKDVQWRTSATSTRTGLPPRPRASRQSPATRQRPSTICAGCWTIEMWTPSSSPRPTTGTRRPRSWPCDAGKHVYVEKPCCHNIREGRLMVEAAERSGKVLQVGTQSRSTPFLKEAIQRLHEGEIGEVLVAKAWNSQRRGSIGKTQPSQPPPHLDFDLWVGPAPMVPYRSNLLPGIWRWWYDFGCGDIGNDGVHDIDVALWGLGVKTHPTRVTCLGGKYFFDDDQQFPDTQYAVFEYPRDGAPEGRTKQLIFEQRIWSPYVQEGYETGAAFYGTRGMLLVGHVKGWKLYGERNKLIAEATGQPTLGDHYDNFFACIRGEAKQPAADAADRPPRGNDLPPGQHLGPRRSSAEFRSRERNDRRRRTGERNDSPPLSRRPLGRAARRARP